VPSSSLWCFVVFQYDTLESCILSSTAEMKGSLIAANRHAAPISGSLFAGVWVGRDVEKLTRRRDCGVDLHTEW
jgi:hypothetical protein